MRRCRLNDKQRFGVAAEEIKRELAAQLDQRRHEMDRAWHDLGEGQADLDKWITDVGVGTSTNPRLEGMLWLNIGGSNFTAPGYILDGLETSHTARWTFADLFQAKWDNRVPRSKDGFIVLDESPVCVKHLLNKLMRFQLLEAPLPLADEGFLRHVAHALGLSQLLPPEPMVLSGSSSVLGDNDLTSLLAVIQRWCPGSPAEMQLLYRASTNGWSLRTFHDRCDDSSPTITLVRTTSNENGGVESVIGGYSSVSMRPTHFRVSDYRASPDAFLFMLEDGSTTGSTFFEPTKWCIKRDQARYAVHCGSRFMPRFGRDGDFKVDMQKVATGNSTYDVPEGSRFAELDGQIVVDLEVFALVSKPATSLPRAEQATIDLTDDDRMTGKIMKDDARRFGVAIADLLLEEATVLQKSHAELQRARAKASASASALRAVYGPHVAAGKQDAVVELSVRGIRITTLLSTLQACPDSPLAARFDDRKWPATEKETDDQGCRVINDCSPYVFSKVLDVLRMRKREAWAAVEEGPAEHGPTVQVSVKAADREPFEEFVHMYFPGNERFIVDRVKYWDCAEVAPSPDFST